MHICYFPSAVQALLRWSGATEFILVWSGNKIKRDRNWQEWNSKAINKLVWCRTDLHRPGNTSHQRPSLVGATRSGCKLTGARQQQWPSWLDSQFNGARYARLNCLFPDTRQSPWVLLPMLVLGPHRRQALCDVWPFALAVHQSHRVHQCVHQSHRVYGLLHNGNDIVDPPPRLASTSCSNPADSGWVQCHGMSTN